MRRLRMLNKIVISAVMSAALVMSTVTPSFAVEINSAEENIIEKAATEGTEEIDTEEGDTEEPTLDDAASEDDSAETVPETLETEETASVIQDGNLSQEDLKAMMACEPKSYGYDAPAFKPAAYTPSPMERSLRAALPTKYDSRTKNLITPVQDQNPIGNCWSFAALASLEASLINKGVANKDNINLSESHLTYFISHTGYDELGNNPYDTSVPTYNDFYDWGGNEYRATAALSNWKGAALESQFPHVNQQLKNNFASMGNRPYKDAKYYMKESYITPMTDTATVKQMVMDYGSLSVSFYYSNYFMNFATSSYYCPYAYTNNHAVSLVGWDDDYPASNFSKRPSRNGAWLLKNSWGTDFSPLGGYFYVSYDDATIINGNAAAFIGDVRDDKLNNYYYSGTAGVGWERRLGAIAESFTAKGNDGKSEIIESAGFMTDDANIDYTVSVYTAPSGQSIDINTATPVHTESGRTKYAGYYMHTFNSPVRVSAGDRFVVAFRFNSNPYILYDSDYKDSICDSRDYSNYGESFIGYYSDYLYDACEDSITPRMNIITRDATVPAKVTDVSLITSGRFGINMYVQVPKSMVKDGAYALIDAKTQHPAKQYIKDCVVKSSAMSDSSETIECCFTAYRAAKELNDEVTLELRYPNGARESFIDGSDNLYSTFSCSMMEKFKELRNSQLSGSKGYNFFNNAMAYANLAQKYFGYETDRIDSGVRSISIPGTTADKFAKVISGTIPDGLHYEGSSLLLRNSITINHYFRIANGRNIKDYDFDLYDAAGNKLMDLNPTDDGEGLYYVSIASIPPTKYQEYYVLKVNNTYSLKYSASSYVNDAIKKNKNADLVNLMNAYYNYGAASKAFFE